MAGLPNGVGAEHPSTLAASINLANDLFALGGFARALALNTATWNACGRVLDAGQPSPLAYAANLALDLIVTGLVDDGQQLRAEAVGSLAGKPWQEHTVVVELTTADRRADCDIDPLPV